MFFFITYIIIYCIVIMTISPIVRINDLALSHHQMVKQSPIPPIPRVSRTRAAHRDAPDGGRMLNLRPAVNDLGPAR
jgi:hypothetical protein